jgi:Flp pilus assembly protein protease CpaA
MDLETLPRIAAIVLAGFCALSDFLKGRIYNRALVAGAILAVAWLGLLGLWVVLELPTDLDLFPELGPDYGTHALRVLANAGVALAAGFGLWWAGLWAAGDAKLFAVLALLVPLSTYEEAWWPLFPAYVLLFNTFLGLLAVLSVEVVFRIARQAVRPTPEEVASARQALAWVKEHVREVLLVFVGMLFLFLVIKTLRRVTRDLIADFTEFGGSTLTYLALFVLYHPLSLAMRRTWVLVPIAGLTTAGIVWFSLFPTEEYNLEMVLQIGTLAGIIVGVRILYEMYLAVFDYRAIRLWELRPRMLLAARTLEILKEDEDLLKTKLGPVGPDGLGEDQVRTLRRWWIDRRKGPRLWVLRTIPFGPALFVGTVLTVVLKGYVVKV